MVNIPWFKIFPKLSACFKLLQIKNMNVGQFIRQSQTFKDLMSRWYTQYPDLKCSADISKKIPSLSASRTNSYFYEYVSAEYSTPVNRRHSLYQWLVGVLTTQMTMKWVLSSPAGSWRAAHLRVSEPTGGLVVWWVHTEPEGSPGT